MPDPRPLHPAVTHHDPKINASTGESRSRMIEKARESGVPKDVATKAAEAGTRQLHETLNRRR